VNRPATIRILCASDVTERIGWPGLIVIEEFLRFSLQEQIVSLGLSDLVDVAVEGSSPQVLPQTIEVDLCGAAITMIRLGAVDNAEALAADAWRWIFSNRDLLVTRALATELWTSVTRAQLPDAEADVVQHIIADAVMRGCLVPQVMAACVEAVRDGCAPDALTDAVEMSFDHEDETIHLDFSARLKAEFNGASLAELSEAVFARTGISLPPPVTREIQGSHPSAREWRLRLKRLTSPIYDAGHDPIMTVLVRELSSYAGLRLTLPRLERMLAGFIAAFPMPMFNAFEVLGSVRVLSVLRTLAAEGVPIKDFRTILGALLEVRGTIELTRDELEGLSPTSARVIPRVAGERSLKWIEERCDYVRLRLRDQLCGRLADADGTLTVSPISRRIEDRFADPQWSITPREAWHLSQAILKSSSPTADSGPVLLVSYSRRRAVRQAIYRHVSAVQVLCSHELDGALITKRAPEIDYSFTT
jgi:hypothetical protein